MALPHEQYDQDLAALAERFPERYRYIPLNDHVYLWVNRSLTGERVE